MTAGPEALTRLSPSALLALRWGAAAAAHREGLPPGPEGPAVEAADLLVGILLANPRRDGEVRMLLEHFGLTVRDVLPPDFPAVSAEELQRRARDLNLTGAPPLGQTALVCVNEAQVLATTGEVELAHLLGGLLSRSSPLRTPFTAAFSAAGDNFDTVAGSYQLWIREDPEASRPEAGPSLARWLRDKNARQPVDVPTYASDQVDASQDLIGIEVEADAFAYLIASRDLTPPLAVGLFGDWGSGKSFLMRAIQERIKRFHGLVEDTEQHASPVWRQIKQIEFNAWEYVQGNLWAGLLERIFRDLGSVPATTSLVERRHAPLLDRLRKEKVCARAAAVRAARLEQERKQLEQQLEAAKQQAKTAREEAEKETERLLGKEAKDSVRRALAELWDNNRLELLGKPGVDLLDALAEAKAEMRRVSSLSGPFWRNPWHIVLLSLAVLLVPGVAFWLDARNAPPLVSLLGGLASLVPIVTTALRAATGWTHKQMAQLEAAEVRVRAQVKDAIRKADQKVADAEQAVSGVREDAAKAHGEAEAARGRADALRARLRELTPGRVFVDFADERSTDYRRRLGLLSTVRQDLSELANQVRDNNRQSLDPHLAADPEVPNRIVLYIDDLDRCPPEKVVQVLEAVHLLLAFELFVVVVAVDTRWLSSALTEELHALKQSATASEQPTPRDYIEKIFQLPFWVQPLTDDARAQLMRGLLAGSVRAADDGGTDNGKREGLVLGPDETESLEAMLGHRGSALRLETSQLALSPDDLRFIESLAPLLGDTPRRVKRFVNTCQLLLAMRPPLRADETPSQRYVVCLLAAVNEGLPRVADELFAVAAKKTPGTLGSLIDDDPSKAKDEHWAALKAWLDKHQEWRTVPTSSLAVRLDAVRRLRFGPPARFPSPVHH